MGLEMNVKHDIFKAANFAKFTHTKIAKYEPLQLFKVCKTFSSLLHP